MDINWDKVISIHQDWSDIDSWHEGQVILVDKPLDWTSFDLVNKLKIKLKYCLGIKKIKLGHGGTLDPKATGLMILLSGKCTKLTDQIHTYSKTYIAEIFLGATTPCFDSERPVDYYFPTDHITPELIDTALQKFKGNIVQYPPSFSAVKINGKTAYKSAHKGIQIATRPRQVEIHHLEILDLHMPILKIKVTCSSGTYIRSLANDIGKALDSGAYLHSLIRTEIGKWELSKAFEMDTIMNKLEAYQSQIIES